MIKKDPNLGKIIKDNGPLIFKPNKDNQFDSLVGIVISQFISTKAANSIFQGIKNNFSTKNLNESNFKHLKVSDIKNLGLSTNKAKTIKELSDLFNNKKFIDLTKLESEELKTNLLSVFGIGPWSVNMFEIFCCGNLDIFSSKDAGLRLAMNKAGMVKPKAIGACMINMLKSGLLTKLLQVCTCGKLLTKNN